MKKKMLLAAILASAAVTNIGLANYQPQPLGADEKPPIVIQVEKNTEDIEQHEGRIGTLETKTDTLENQVGNNASEVTIVKDRVVVVENKLSEQPKPAPTPSPAPEPVPVSPYKVIKFERIYHTNGQYPLLKCVYHTYNGEIWWTAARNPYVTDKPCQYDNPTELTESMRKNLTNRPIDVF